LLFIPAKKAKESMRLPTGALTRALTSAPFGALSGAIGMTVRTNHLAKPFLHQTRGISCVLDSCMSVAKKPNMFIHALSDRVSV